LVKISVILTVFNGERFLAEAIQSILDQTYRNFELIIIDDGSTDGSLDIIGGFSDDRIKLVVNETNKGQSYSRNKGNELARGEYIAIMDSDDIALLQRLEKQVSFLESNPNISLCSAQATLIDENSIPFGEKKTPESDWEIKLKLLFYCPIIHPTVMFRKTDFLNNNLVYDEHFVYAQDFDLWSRAMEKLNFYGIQENLLLFRFKHAGSISNANVIQQSAYAKQIIERNMKKYVGINYSDPKSEWSKWKLFKRIINATFLINYRKEKVMYFRKQLFTGNHGSYRIKEFFRSALLS
jgi:glycosyltransferase involved in cell wall biosynthesis